MAAIIRERLERDVVLNPETLSDWAKFAFAKWQPYRGEEYDLILEAQSEWIRVRKDVFARAKGRCEYCGRRFRAFGREVHVDHFVPKAKGGTDLIENLRLACRACNLSKGDMLYDDWRAKATPEAVAEKAAQKAADRKVANRKSRRSTTARRWRGRQGECAECGAKPKEPCVGARGQERKANHASRGAK